MGLSGPRNRRKLDYDPNNTRWTRDETTFGQKILRSQGWEPGKYLGAQDTTHAQLHSAASLAPIKINLKDDTLGLGAKIRQKQSDECTGLDVFKDLLGRLNGKSEETIEKQRQVRSEIKTNLFVERRYGPMRFVSGGLLVGDQRMEELVNKKPESTLVKDEPMSEASEVESVKKEKKSKKRKASESEESDTSDSKREKKRKKRSKGSEESNIDDAEADKSTKKKKDKKEKKSKRSERALEEEKDVEPVESEVKRKKSKKSKDASPQESLSNSAETSEDGASEKARKKEKKRQKKRKQTDSAEASAATETIESSTATPQVSGTSTPTGALASHALSARHRARSRNIASKRLAIGNMQALNQIFMVKPV
ncbi:hypothetical protein GGR58DRAFT_477704 [Xylaria digitata]|nr:hypothetical protein GGR58DRAFT_477704 [Xylaria digitata]